MDVLHQHEMYWKLLHHLVIKEGFRLIERSPDKKQAWLEYESRGQRKIVRVSKYTISWKNHLKKDHERARKMFQQMKRQLGARKASFYNVYVMEFPPVDHWKDLQSNQNDEGTRSTDSHQLYVCTPSPFSQSENEQVESLFADLQLSSSWEGIPEELTMENQRAMVYKTEVLKHTEAIEHKERSLLLSGKPRFTYLLLLSILLIYMMVEQNGGSTNILNLIDYGAKYNPMIMEGEWWRLFTAMFLHIGFIHLFMNALALLYLGGAVERIYGTWRFICIYMIAGLFGSIASFAFNAQVSAGASGAIFGCFGALLYFGCIHRSLFFRTMGMNVIFILVINLSFGFIVPMVDNGAHIGGLIGGFLGSAIVHLPRHRFRNIQVVTTFLTVLVAFGLFAFGYINDDKATAPLVDVQIGQELLNKERYEEAYPYLERAVEQDAQLAEGWFLLAYADVHLNQYTNAKAHLQKAIDLNKSFHEAYYNLALVYLELGDEQKAQQSVEKAVELQPSEESYQELLDSIR